MTPAEKREREREVKAIVDSIKELNAGIEADRESMSAKKNMRCMQLDRLSQLGLNGSDIARELDVSRQRVSQLRNGN